MLNIGSWDWATIAQSFLGAGFATALVQIVVPVIRDNRAARRRGAFHALQVALYLEHYARQASDIVSDDEMLSDSSGHAGEKAESMPKLGTMPDDADGWRALPQGLMERAMSFPQRVGDSSREIMFMWTVDGPEELSSTISRECVDRGLDALDLAARLRDHYRFPEQPTATIDHLRKRKGEFDVYDRERQEASARMFASMPQTVAHA